MYAIQLAYNYCFVIFSKTVIQAYYVITSIAAVWHVTKIHLTFMQLCFLFSIFPHSSSIVLSQSFFHIQIPCYFIAKSFIYKDVLFLSSLSKLYQMVKFLSRAFNNRF